MLAYAPCKINLDLRILGKRPDGYHDIQSLMVPIDWCDCLEIAPSIDSKPTLITDGVDALCDPEDNLVVKAWGVLKEQYDIPAIDAHLYKKVPVGAGLGGGSSDAALALSMMNNLFALSLKLEHLEYLASKLGSDCPFFIQPRVKIVRGRGDELEAFHHDIPSLHVAILLPQFSISTARAYSMVGEYSDPISYGEVVIKPVEQWKYLLHNDFENALKGEYPEIIEMKKELYDAGALYASLSGSGAAVYGLFEERVSIDKAHWTRMIL